MCFTQFSQFYTISKIYTIIMNHRYSQKKQLKIVSSFLVIRTNTQLNKTCVIFRKGQPTLAFRCIQITHFLTVLDIDDIKQEHPTGEKRCNAIFQTQSLRLLNFFNSAKLLVITAWGTMSCKRLLVAGTTDAAQYPIMHRIAPYSEMLLSSKYTKG